MPQIFAVNVLTAFVHSTTDLDDEDYDLSETSIQNWIVKLPKAKFNLVGIYSPICCVIF